MNYRDFGATGETISALGFGCMRLPEYEKDGVWQIDEDKAIPLLQEAYRLGVNYFDSAFFYLHGNSERTVGKALKDVRGNVKLSTKIPVGEVEKTSDYRRFLETSLEKMGTDYIDYYHFWGINKGIFDDRILKLGLLEEALKAKQEGLIRHISFSFHDEPANMEYIIDRAGILETVLVQYNLLDRSCEKQIAYARSKGLGVVAMGPVGGGRLAAPAALSEKLMGDSTMPTYELAFRFVLGNPDISCALSGMENMDMLRGNVAAASGNLRLTPAEWRKIADSLENLARFSELYCTGCNYCQPCPAGIGISDLFRMYTYHNVYGLSDLAGRDFARYLAKEGGAALIADCTGCGHCESKCPQHIQVRRELARVEKILRTLMPPSGPA